MIPEVADLPVAGRREESVHFVGGKRASFSAVAPPLCSQAFRDGVTADQTIGDEPV
jgi:hypothetical protein